MALYTMYWPDWMCSGAQELGLEGTVLEELWGGHNQDARFSRFKVGPGDRVVPITSIDGVVFALAMIVVKEKSTFHSWIDANPAALKRKVRRTGDEVLSAVEGKGVPLAFHRAFTGAQLEAWRYDGSDGPRPLKHLKAGKLTKPLSIQGVYRVRPETEALIEAVLALEAKQGPKPKSSELMQRLRKAPRDEEVARVLADAWQDEGDARGELLSLELELAKGSQNVSALDERHAKLMRGKGLKKEAGGFFFRERLGGRTHWLVNAVLRAPTLAAARARFSEACERFFDSPSWRSVVSPALRNQLRPFYERLGATAKPPHSVWSLESKPSDAELEELFALDPQALVSAHGAVKTGGVRLPFQAPSQWLGSPLRSEVVVNASARQVKFVARAPEGSPLTGAFVDEATAWLKAHAFQVGTSRLRRADFGDVLEPLVPS